MTSGPATPTRALSLVPTSTQVTAPVIRIERGNPDDDEIAAAVLAVLAVVSAARDQAGAADRGVPASWRTARWRRAGGPGAWAAA